MLRSGPWLHVHEHLLHLAQEPNLQGPVLPRHQPGPVPAGPERGPTYCRVAVAFYVRIEEGNRVLDYIVLTYGVVVYWVGVLMVYRFLVYVIMVNRVLVYGLLVNVIGV